MYYLETDSNDPYFNLAMEQYTFDHLKNGESCFMLWQNANSIIIGKYQNAYTEINSEFVREHGIKVARRLSGGGAVYHDLGNLNYTYISDEGESPYDFAAYSKIIVETLNDMGVAAEITGRNDMTVDGKKFSGTAQYHTHGRVMHHGTLLFDSDLGILSEALNVKPDKYASKGVKSVRSRVTNLKQYMHDYEDIYDFWGAIRAAVLGKYDAVRLEYGEPELDAIRKLRDELYATHEWNYGKSPAYHVTKDRYIEGCGRIEVHMNVLGGFIDDIRFFGDFFSSSDPLALAALIKGCSYEENSLRERLDAADISSYIRNLTSDSLIRILLE